MCKIKIGGIINDSIVDGPGLRLAIFMQGCSNKCPGCHNPHLQNFDGGKYFTCQEILDIAKKNPLIDGPFILEKRNLSLKFRGSENQHIIDVQKSLAQNKIVLDKFWY